MFRRAVWLALALWVAPAFLYAQGRAAAVPGDRVRVTGPGFGGGRVVGTLGASQGDTLVVNGEDGRSWRVPFSAVTGFEVSRGTKSNAGKGALIGGVIGAGAGLALGLAALSEEESTFYDFEEAEVVGATVVLGGAGALVGALIGLTARSERWEEVSLRRLRFVAAPQRDGSIALGVRITI